MRRRFTGTLILLYALPWGLQCIVNTFMSVYVSSLPFSTEKTVGNVMAFGSAVTMLSQLVWSKIAYRCKNRFVLLFLSLLLIVLFCLPFLLVKMRLPLLYASVFLFYFCFMVHQPLLDAITTENAERLTLSFGAVRSFSTFGYALAGLICGVAGFAVAYLPALFNLINLVLNDSYEIGTGSEEGGMIAVLIYAAILLYGFAFADKNNKHYAMFICMTACALTCMILRQLVSGILERVSEYFAYAQMVVISNGTSSISKERDQVVFGIFIFCLCMVVAIYKTTYSELIPYNFFWQ